MDAPTAYRFSVAAGAADKDHSGIVANSVDLGSQCCPRCPNQNAIRWLRRESRDGIWPPNTGGLGDGWLFSDGSFFLSGSVLAYNRRMTAKLTKELAAALHATGDHELEVIDPDTSRVYFIVESEMHRQAMDALRRQQDRDAIAQGIAEMEAGQGIPLADARKLTRDRLLARKQ